MMAGKSQSSQIPTAFGSMLQASTYGMTIPVIYGRTISPLLAIWAANLRQGGSLKKLKQLKKGITAYTENIDFLLGKNPILGVLQFWVNNSKYPLNFVTQTFTGGTAGQPWTITDPNFYAVIGVTYTSTYSQTFNDYGGSGPQTVSGSYEIPLWNQLVSGPDPTANSGYRNWPYIYRWQPSFGATVYSEALANASLAGNVTIYYAQLSSATLPKTPISKLRMQFENVLGSGTEYAGFASQQIQYPDYAGCGSDSIDLGSSGTIPAIKPETQGKFGTYPSGDCDFVDIIEDIIKSGITQAAIGGTVGFGSTQHGVACFNFPGAIQKKVQSGSVYFGDPISYDLPTAAGNFLVAIATSQSSRTFGIFDTAGNVWTPVFPAGNLFQVWYAKSVGGATAVTITEQP